MRAELPGQNPKAEDPPDHDVRHDEERVNRNPNEAQGERTTKGEKRKAIDKHQLHPATKIAESPSAQYGIPIPSTNLPCPGPSA